MKRGRKSPFTREQVILVAASFLILAALTVTGVYLKRQNATMYDGYRLDLADLENETQEKNTGKTLSELPKGANTKTANSNNVKIPSAAPAKKEEVLADIIPIRPAEPVAKTPKKAKPQSDKPITEQAALPEDIALSVEQTADTPIEGNSAEAISQNLEGNIFVYQFSDTDKLQWPLTGNVLINYSMDKSVYFTTLDQYKYNPAVIIGADFGAAVSSSANGQVSKIFYDNQIGTAVTVDIGGGYSVTYAQLDNLQVKEGDAVSAGQVIAYIGNPTKYYSVEGSNLYFKLTKDNVPINPMVKLA